MKRWAFVSPMKGSGLFRAECHNKQGDGEICGWWQDCATAGLAEAALDEHGNANHIAPRKLRASRKTKAAA